MEENIQNVLVFTTNIKTKLDKRKVSNILNTNTDIIKWNIDTQDIDCVLRIVTNKLSISQIIETIKQHNFECEVLE
jgi:hypothetical protein